MPLIAASIIFFASIGHAARFGYSIVPDDISEEIAASSSTHPWAGIYGGSGGMSPDVLYLAPSGRYCATTFWDAGGRETGYCGQLHFDNGRFTEGWWVQIRGNRHYHAPPFLLIPWGERHYIVEERRILDFINGVNSADEPRVEQPGSSAYLRSGEDDILVLGLPDVPKKYRPLLLSRPISATAVAVSSRTAKGDGEDGLWEYSSKARFDIGSSSGVFVGMELYAQNLDRLADTIIVEVSTAYSIGRIGQMDLTGRPSTPIVSGTVFSSRPAWRINISLSTEPLSTTIKFASAKRFAPFVDGTPEQLFFDDPFQGATAAGFTVEKIGDVIFEGPFLGALGMRDVRARMERTILSIGGNAYIRTDRNEQQAAEEAGGIEKRRLEVFLLSFHGRPLDPGANFRLPARNDWKRSILSVRASSCGLGVAARQAERAVFFDILKWDESTFRRAHMLRFQDLNSEQLVAVSPFISADTHTDYVWPALMHEPSALQAEIREHRLDAEKGFTKAHPKIAEECKQLEKASRFNPWGHFWD